MTWQDLAACKGLPLELFDDDGRTDITYALWTCNNCSVRERCLDDALASESDEPRFRFGVRGGKTRSERYAMWRAEQRRVAV